MTNIQPASQTVPYFAQWESKHLVEDFISGNMRAESDPMWQRSGAKTPQEYSYWARHLCGMACLKMVLAKRGREIMPIIELAKSCCEFGGYKVNIVTKEIKGLFYKPFVEFISDKFGISAEAHANISAEAALELVNNGAFFIASVHPSIRNPKAAPPSKGGHLILLFRNETSPNKFRFHNPSGFTQASQEYVEMDVKTFDQFYAARGISVRI